MLNYVRIFLIWMVWMCPLSIFAAEGPSPVKVELIQEEKSIQPNRPFWVALRLKLEEGWHVYWKNPGDAGMPLQVEWKLPAGFEAGPLQWPFPEKFNTADMVGFGYKDEVVLLTQITPPSNLKPGTKLSVEGQANWLVCSASACQPGSAPFSLPLTIKESPPQLSKEVLALFEEARAKIPHTHIEIKTSRKEGIVHLEVPKESASAHKETIKEAYFFPEHKDVIDHSIAPQVTVSPSHDNRYLVSLKGSDEIGAESHILKGVLVLHTQKGIQAIDVHSPIQELGELDLVALRESSDYTPSIGQDTPSDTSFSFAGGWVLALFFAFLGGMILNLMPCVLPVISFKVMSFIKMAGQSRALIFKHGLMFSFGVILSFWILASLMLILRAYGQSVGWGFQLQEPLFVVFLASLLFIFAISLFGVFEWGMFFASWAGQAEVEKTQKSSGYIGSFFSGVLATAVATPCTGPFLGSAVGFAVTLPIWQALLIFTSLGLGMCFPYLLLAAFPSYLRFMPKPGAWMETFKQLMGFLLLATVLWLLWVFSAQTDSFSLLCLLTGFLCFSIAAWIYGKGCSPIVSRVKRAIGYVCVIFFAFVGCQVILFPRASWSIEANDSSLASKKDVWAGWEEFSPERVEQLRKEGRPILIDFTAKWCLICQANHMVLSSAETEKKLAEAGVVKLKADWTKNDPVITKELSKFGRNSVPLYVLYGGKDKKDPVLLPQVLTAEVVSDHLKQALPPDEEIALK